MHRCAKAKRWNCAFFPPSAIEIPLPAPPPLVVGCGWVIHCASVKQIWIIFQSDDIERSVGSSLAVGWEPPAFLRLQKSPPFPNSVFLCWSGGCWHTPARWMTDPLWRTLLSCPGGSVGGGGQPAPIRPPPQGRRSHGGHNHDRSLMVPTSAPIPGRVRGGRGDRGVGPKFSPPPHGSPRTGLSTPIAVTPVEEAALLDRRLREVHPSSHLGILFMENVARV